MGDQGLGSPLYPGNNTMVEEPQYSFNATGLASIIVFYIIILLIGLWAGWKQKKRLRVEGRKEDTETVLVANRDIKLFVGIMTMGATWVGGGFINGTAEEVYTNGLVHTLAPFGYSLSILFNAVLFAKKMRESNYITMIDPFTEKYGKLGSIIAFPAAMSEIICAVISVVYTLLGGLISVAYTDVFQLFFMATGLFLAIPFVLTNPATGNITDIQKYDWIGTVTSDEIPGYVDNIFTYILGGIPWQCYYQRVLSSKTPRRAQWLSVGGCSIALFMIIPSAIFGAAGKAIDWSKTPIPAPSTPETRKIILPLVLQYLTPGWVTFFGMGAVSAAVMSSTDSSMLSAASMLARNVYQKVFRPKASEKEILIILSTIVAFNCVLATLLAIYYPSVYDLFAFCKNTGSEFGFFLKCFHQTESDLNFIENGFIIYEDIPSQVKSFWILELSKSSPHGVRSHNLIRVNYNPCQSLQFLLTGTI
ncbi:SLC5A7 [Lepeophtheirus salmonis]|uniref:SLC5A7 n=1 Tax=Lepeophtheirus salmonis TaxID=72036 RepID=A0A7R8HB94_LEPSM|nr:SLC5A7 [Lepeophtheirus salmonis]CAF2970170.1 SLC5A7 [Lepeophtheirus salmonis]